MNLFLKINIYIIILIITKVYNTNEDHQNDKGILLKN